MSKKPPPPAPRKRPKPTVVSLFDVIESQLSGPQASTAGESKAGTSAKSRLPIESTQKPNVKPVKGEEKTAKHDTEKKKDVLGSGTTSAKDRAASKRQDNQEETIVRHRGFQRETPRPKKLTAMKRAVLLQRGLVTPTTAMNDMRGADAGTIAAQTAEQQPNEREEGDSSGNSDSSDVGDSGDEAASFADGAFEGSESVSDSGEVEEAQAERIAVIVRAAPNESSPNVDARLSQTPSATPVKAWDGINLKLALKGLPTPARVEVANAGISKDGQDTTGDRVGEVDPDKSDGLPPEQSTSTKPRRRRRKKKTSTETDNKTESRHRNAFAYCTQTHSTAQDELVTALLDKLVQFQTRSRNLNPVKAKAKRRIVLGMREVLRHSSRGKLKVVIVARNVEPSPGPAGTSAFLNALLDACHRNNIPVVFSMTRRQLATAIVHTKEVAVTCVGILLYDGAETHFKEVVANAERLGDDWLGTFVQKEQTLERNESPIWIAGQQGYRDPAIYRRASENGWNPDEIDSVDGNTPLIIALKHAHDIAACSLLSACHVDVTLRNFAGESAAHVACASGCENALHHIFLSLGDPARMPAHESLQTFRKLISTQSYEGFTCLGYASRVLSSGCIRRLVTWAKAWNSLSDLGLSTPDPEGYIPIQRCASGSEPVSLALLLGVTSEIAHVSTALLSAAKVGSDACLRLCIQRITTLLTEESANAAKATKPGKGINIREKIVAALSAIDAEGLNALDWAKRSAFIECARLLEEQGVVQMSSAESVFA